MRPSKLLIGVGNVLRRDDGVGVLAAARLNCLSLPADVEIFEAGTVGIDAACILEGRKLVVVVDAIDAGEEPGTVLRLAPEQLRPYVQSNVSLHDLHLLDALDETHLLGTAPESVVVFGVQMCDWSTGIGLSPPVEAALDDVLRLAAETLGLPPHFVDEAMSCVSFWDLS